VCSFVIAMKTFSIYGSDALRACEDKIEFCFVAYVYVAVVPADDPS